MAHLYGYTFETKAGRPVAAQDAALREAGITDFSDDGEVYRDVAPRKPKGPVPRPGLGALIVALRPEAVVVLAGLDVLAPTRDGLRERLAEIGAAGAVVRLMDTGETLDPRPEAVAVAAAIERAAQELQRQRAAAARGSAAWAQSARGGPRFKWTEKQYRDALPIYQDLANTIADIEAKQPIPYRTLHRLAKEQGKERGAPAFGRGRPPKPETPKPAPKRGRRK